VETSSDFGTTRDRSEICTYCGGRPVLSRARETGPNGFGICRACLVGLTETAEKGIEESSGVPTQGNEALASNETDPVDEETLWARFDPVFARLHLLHSIERMAEWDQEMVNYQWSGDSANQSSAHMAQDIEVVRALLTKYGYKEVSVVTGIDQELVETGKRGRFTMRADPNRPRWTAQVVFRRDLKALEE